MKNCVFTELSVVSFQERRARQILFDRATNVFVGSNDTGKSSLLKCLYWAFGAEPSVTHPIWATADVAASVGFEIEGKAYSILRKLDQFVLRDQHGSVLARERRITNGIGPRIAELFDFGLVTTDRDGKEFVPPPAFLFLPYYIDQEASWKTNWSGFRRLEQVRGYRKLVSEYHVGIRPNAYYEAKSELDRDQLALSRLQAERTAVLGAKRTADESLPFRGFDIDVAAFAEDVDDLLVSLEELAKRETAYRESLQDRRSERQVVELQIKAVKHEIAELKADNAYANAPARLARIECPTCGAFHEDSFLDRFELARDVDRCEDLLRQLERDLEQLNDGIAKTEAAFTQTTSDRARLEETLARSRGAITLRDVIASEGRKQVQQVFRDQLSAYAERIHAADGRIASVKRTLKSLTNAKERDRILSAYRERTSRYLDALNVDTLPPQAYSAIDSRIKETGSDLPRALLAYYYAILHTIRNHGSSVYCPIVIDSPNQQGQDNRNLPAMIDFIFSRRPEGSQLVVACEDLHGVHPGGLIVPFETKGRVLREEEFDAVAAAVRPALNDALGLEGL